MKYKLDAGAFMPSRGHKTDAGLDLRAKHNGIVEPHGSAIFETGLHVQLPKNTCGVVIAKSGMNFRYGITSTGLIDEGYTGQIMVKLYNHSDTRYVVRAGDKISQLIVVPCLYEKLEYCEDFDASERGDNGFGSTGK